MAIRKKYVRRPVTTMVKMVHDLRPDTESMRPIAATKRRIEVKANIMAIVMIHPENARVPMKGCNHRRQSSVTRCETSVGFEVNIIATRNHRKKRQAMAHRIYAEQRLDGNAVRLLPLTPVARL
jgi:hypothetical protein